MVAFVQSRIRIIRFEIITQLRYFKDELRRLGIDMNPDVEKYCTETTTRLHQMHVESRRFYDFFEMIRELADVFEGSLWLRRNSVRNFYKRANVLEILENLYYLFSDLFEDEEF
jgi:hypothetical protein